ncbi:kinase-like protein [Aureobasidium pullulans]|nr:kinase-like protein [Aureobasidium pullulans]
MADTPTNISPSKWSVSLPYFDNNDPLINIPTKAMIHASQDIIKENMTSKVVGVGRQFVVKYGRGLDLIEGQNAIWVATHTGIRVPKIYALYEDSEDEIKYIIMERLPGTTLEEAWPSMSNAQKDMVCQQLRDIMQELRALSSPGGYCSLDERPLPDGLMHFEGIHEDPSIISGGPFATEQDLNRAILQRAATFHEHLKGKAKFYERVFSEVFTNHPPTFSHGDFQRKNIMVNFLESGADVALIDWESAAWWPSYYDYSTALFGCHRFADDWHHWLEKVLDPCLKEAPWVLMLINELYY